MSTPGLARWAHSCHWSGRAALRAVVAALLAALAVTVAACGRKEAPVATQVGDLTLETALSPDPPRQQDNTLELTIRDREGRPVDGAQVEVMASMPSMAWVPGMRSRAAVTPQGEGRYRAEFDVVMGGTWALDVAVESAAGAADANYSFTVGSPGLQPLGGTASASSEAVPATERPTWVSVPQEFPVETLAALRAGLAAYEEARALLTLDQLEGLAAAAAQLAGALRTARSTLAGPSSEVTNCLQQGIAAAERLGAAAEIAAARRAFGEVSRFIVALAGLDPRLRAGWHLFECPMTETFPLWLQQPEDLANPYMGPAMGSCGSAREWPPAAAPGGSAPAPRGAMGMAGEISHYSCSMHTTVRSDKAGTCPICSMDLVAVTQEEVRTGVIFVDPQRRQTIGVRTAAVGRRPVVIEVRAVGKVAFDETRLTDVSVKYDGWIGRLEADATGQAVRRGQTLFNLYSPELYAAQEEFLTVLHSQQTARETAAPDRADYLVEASRQRLRLWDLTDSQIDRIAESGKAAQYLPIVSPVSGYVIEKDIVEGGAVEAGMRLYRIAALDQVWVEAEVYESELALIQVGQEARVTLPYLPGESLVGKVAFIYPYLDNMTRTGRVRIELPNRGLELKPDMYANVTLQVDRGERLMVAESAVLYAGPRRLVFLDLGEGRLRAQPIEVGVKSGDFLEVLSGLDEGDVVVTSGTFLIAAESRLKSAVEEWQ